MRNLSRIQFFSIQPWQFIVRLLMLGAVLLAGQAALAAAKYQLGPGDIVKITVYNQPDLTTEAQITDTGKITFPLVGEIAIGGLDKAGAEAAIAQRLREGNYVKQPQVNLLIAQYRSQQVSVLGYVNKPGRYSIDSVATLTDLLALAGGVNEVGSDKVVVIKKDGAGKIVRREIDLPTLFESRDFANNIELNNSDIVYVGRAPMFYVYGEVQKPGAYRLERNMTAMQGIAAGGGLTPRATDKSVRMNRRDKSGDMKTIEVTLQELLQENDVIYVRQSLF